MQSTKTENAKAKKQTYVHEGIMILTQATQNKMNNNKLSYRSWKNKFYLVAI